MTACEDGSFCCGQENTTCCDRNQGTRLAPTIGLVSTSTATTSTTVSTSTSTPSGGATTPTSKAISTPAKIGIATGVSVMIIILWCLAGWYVLHRRRKRLLHTKNNEDSYWSKPELSAMESTRPPSQWPKFEHVENAHEISGQPIVIPVYELSDGRPSSKHKGIR